MGNRGMYSKSERGASLIEYSIMLALVALVLLTAFPRIQSQISEKSAQHGSPHVGPCGDLLQPPDCY